eukprot:SAG31_NODE_21156_length_556_cov_1.404814_1_plen_76_part_00
MIDPLESVIAQSTDTTRWFVLLRLFMALVLRDTRGFCGRPLAKEMNHRLALWRNHEWELLDRQRWAHLWRSIFIL